MKLNYKRTFFIGLAFLSICSFWQLYDNLIPLMLRDTFHMKETLIGIVMALDNVLALFLLPFFGTLSDKTDTRFGRRTPYIMGGTAAAIISMLMLPLSDRKESLLLFIIALGITLVAMGTYRSPAVALMPDLTPKPMRSKANAVINLMGAVGGIITLGLIRVLVKSGERPDYLPVFLSVAVIMGVSVILLLLTVPEKKLAAEIRTEDELEAEELHIPGGAMAPEVRRSLIFLLASVFFWFAAYNAVTTAFSRYATHVWGMTGGSFSLPLMVGMGAAILSYIPIGILSTRYGRKKMILAGILAMTASYLAGTLFTHYTPLVYIIFVIVGFGWASISVNSYPMVVEMSKNGDVGRYTGIYYTFSMSAQIMTPIFSGYLLEHVSYSTLFPYAAVFSLLALLTMTQVKHGDSKAPQKKDILENFDIDD